MKMPTHTERPLLWIASAKKDLEALPDDLRSVFGYALYLAQQGDSHSDAKALKSFGGGVLEIVADHSGDTYRAVYTVKYADAVYVLHVFQKKSKKGIATPKLDLELIKSRLKLVAEMRKSEVK